MNVQFNTAPPPATGSREPAPSPQQAAPAPVAQAPAAPASADAIQQAARRINEFLKSSATDVEFAVDGRSNKVVVRVVDSQTKQVIRQMPTEEMLAISQSLDQMSGLLFRQEA
jgi:flagellar protein FlaG